MVGGTRGKCKISNMQLEKWRALLLFGPISSFPNRGLGTRRKSQSGDESPHSLSDHLGVLGLVPALGFWENPKAATSRRTPYFGEMPCLVTFLGLFPLILRNRIFSSSGGPGSAWLFNAAGNTDLAIGARASWEEVTRGFPGGWQPDFIVLYLPYTTIPQCLWSAPVPLVGLAADWTLLWHYFRWCLRKVDLVFTDKAGVEALAKEGIGQARAANLFGLEKSVVSGQWPVVRACEKILFLNRFLSPPLSTEGPGR